MEPMTILFIISLTLTSIAIIGAIGTYIWRLWHPNPFAGSESFRKWQQDWIRSAANRKYVGPKVLPLTWKKEVAQPEPLTEKDVQGMYDRYVTLWIDSKARNAALRTHTITHEALVDGKNDFLRQFDMGIDKRNEQDKSFSLTIHKALDGDRPLKNEKFNTARRDKIVQTVLKGQELPEYQKTTRF